MANVYLIVSDLHKSPNRKKNRFDYGNEIYQVELEIMRLIKHYRFSGNKVYLIFLGDLFDRGIKDSDSAMGSLNEASYLCSKADGSYSVVGNHEKTYKKGNPFWHLVKSVDSSKLNANNNGLVLAKGKSSTVKIIDRLEDGEVEFIFNHHGVGVSNAKKGKVSIGLFHQDIVFREILDEAKMKNRKLFELDESTMKDKYDFSYIDRDDGILSNYNYCFFAHMHKLYGTWNMDNCTLVYLASLGRPNHTEVQENFLERIIPAIVVNDGVLDRVDYNKFDLASRVSSVNEVAVTKASIEYERVKEVRSRSTSQALSSDPIENIKIMLNSDKSSKIIDSILSDISDPLLDQIGENREVFFNDIR